MRFHLILQQGESRYTQTSTTKRYSSSQKRGRNAHRKPPDRPKEPADYDPLRPFHQFLSDYKDKTTAYNGIHL